ncbi:hypothetical protein [Candidatus Thioglobus sp.]|uniref:hypothetical protein n=1 Tax=Candidatus Thioglobus sp. TaxID=2026721 RepID=UPI003D14BF2A
MKKLAWKTFNRNYLFFILGGGLLLALILLFQCWGGNKEFKYSYYSPGKGTVNMEKGKDIRKPISLIGKDLPDNLLVITDMGRSVVVVGKEGKVLYEKLNIKVGRSFAIDFKKALIPVKNVAKMFRLDSFTFADEADEIEFNHTKSIGFISKHGDQIVAGDYVKDGTIRVFKENKNKELIEVFKDPIRSFYSRHAITNGSDILFVADTFGQRVYGVDMKSNKKIFEIPSYFPNQIDLIDQDTILITEEHMNRVVSYNFKLNIFKVVASCPIQFYKNSVVTDLKTAEEKAPQFVAEKPIDYPKSLCASSEAGIKTLYSPNGARAYGKDKLLVADTDNHRIVIFEKGEVVTVIDGFNNPSDAAFFASFPGN